MNNLHIDYHLLCGMYIWCTKREQRINMRVCEKVRTRSCRKVCTVVYGDTDKRNVRIGVKRTKRKGGEDKNEKRRNEAKKGRIRKNKGSHQVNAKRIRKTVVKGHHAGMEQGRERT